MDFFDKVKSLFSSGDKGANAPFIHEVIERDEQEKQAFETWKNGKRKDRLIQKLRFDYLNRGQQNDKPDLEVVQTKAANGFVYYFNESLSSAGEVQHLFDYLRERLKANGYMQQLADRRSYVKTKYTEVKERYHMKPRFNWDEGRGKSDQLFGNVTLEHVSRNDKPQYLKLVCSFYTDQNFSPALNFGGLMQLLFDEA